MCKVMKSSITEDTSQMRRPRPRVSLKIDRAEAAIAKGKGGEEAQ